MKKSIRFNVSNETREDRKLRVVWSLRENDGTVKREEGENLLSSSSVILSVPKHFEYLDPELSCCVDGDELVVTSHTYAKSVEILNDREDMILSDNYFDMDKGEKRVKIISGLPEGLKLRSVYNIR
ncbi:glycoside hydrolase family 2 protein [Blautia producta]|uniref:glycoside hydrolase family 2 protein n=1 Tax=Blautia producta TaxID=33035 RepID=UPI001023E67E|nr:glycoside hydrolase family 2 protein [Blautia producta]